MSEMPRVETMRQAIATDAAASHADAAPPRRRLTVRRAVIGVALLAGTALAGIYGHDYWTTGRFLVSTDDAYVKADYTTVAPKVPGYLIGGSRRGQPNRSGRAGSGPDRRPRPAHEPRASPCGRRCRGRDRA